MAEITGQWLESIGFLQDGDDAKNKEYGRRAWSLSHIEDSDDDTANVIQVLVSANDHSLWLEVYAPNGDSLALIEVPGQTQERVLKLCDALGIETKSQPKADFCKLGSAETANHLANARLIAAAPELFNACKAAMQMDCVSPNCDDIYNQIRAAIKKAEVG